MDDFTCKHGRLVGSCEDCQYEQAKAAGLPVHPVSPAEQRKRNEEAAAGVLDEPTPAKRRR